MKGILMKPWKAQAIHEGSPEIEWQTRRIIKPQPDNRHALILGWYHPTMVDKDGEQYPGDAVFGLYSDDGEMGWKCPYTVGEQVYIKESFCKVCYENDGIADVCFKEDMITPCSKAVWESPLFLPADLARTVVEITDIRAQRVQDITREEIRAEGIRLPVSPRFTPSTFSELHQEFAFLWDSIHGEGAWERNDWVWIYSFRMVK